MALRLIVDEHTWESVKTDIQIDGKTVAYPTIGQFLKLNEVAYDSAHDLLYLDFVQDGGGANRLLRDVQVIEVVYGERTSVRGKIGESTYDIDQKKQRIAKMRNLEARRASTQRKLTAVSGAAKKHARVHAPKKR